MLRVPIYLNSKSVDDPIGYITWDGQQLGSIPQDNSVLQLVLDSPTSDAHDILYSDDDPEAWFRSLPSGFGGSYVGAGEVEEV